MKHVLYLSMIVFLAAGCKKQCHLDGESCNEVVINSGLMPDCICACWKGDKILYASPHDGKKVCSNWDSEGTWAQGSEFYMYDHIAYEGGDVSERVIADVSVRFGTFSKDILDDYPYQGTFWFSFLHHHNKKDCTYLALRNGQGGFYLKNGNRDTLFMDKLVGFNHLEYWICDKNRYFISGYAIRNEESLDWHISLYGINNVDDPIDLYFDVHNGVAIPDTILYLHMPKIGSAL